MSVAVSRIKFKNNGVLAASTALVFVAQSGSLIGFGPSSAVAQLAADATQEVQLDALQVLQDENEDHE